MSLTPVINHINSNDAVDIHGSVLGATIYKGRNKTFTGMCPVYAIRNADVAKYIEQMKGIEH